MRVFLSSVALSMMTPAIFAEAQSPAPTRAIEGTATISRAHAGSSKLGEVGWAPMANPVLVGWFAVAAIDSLAQSKMTTGIEGEIRIVAPSGPTRLGIDDSKPLAKTVFVVKQQEKIVASFETDDQGRFQLSLAPGKYRVSKKDWNGRFGQYGPFDVEIGAGEVKKVQWKCDSGMQ